MFTEGKKKMSKRAIWLLCFFWCVFGMETEANAIGRSSGRISDVLMPCNHQNAKVSSSDSTVLSRQEVWRQLPPSSYCLKFQSCSALQRLESDDKYESRPFSVDGYNWTLILYPKGNKNDNGNGYVSIYLAIDNSSLVDVPHEVYADVRFFVYNKNQDKYFTVLDNDVSRFHVFRTVWGVPQFLQLSIFNNRAQGYISDDDQCVFGVDVSVPRIFNKWEVLSIDETYYDRRTWKIPDFSKLYKEVYYAEEFLVGGRNWTLEFYPNGYREGVDNSVSLFLYLSKSQELKPHEQIFVQAKLRILDQLRSQSLERPIVKLFDKPGMSWGYRQFLSLADLRNPSRGYLVKDTLVVQVEFVALSSLEYYSSKSKAVGLSPI